jgi:hypothetical protein
LARRTLAREIISIFIVAKLHLHIVHGYAKRFRNFIDCSLTVHCKFETDLKMRVEVVRYLVKDWHTAGWSSLA